VLRDRASRRASSAGGRARLDCVCDSTVDLLPQHCPVEMNGDRWSGIFSSGVTRQQATSDRHRRRHWYPELAIQSADEGDVMNSVEGDSARHALAATFDSRYVEVREEVVDPLMLGVSCMSSYFNVIES
jgi:hypothetical protein